MLLLLATGACSGLGDFVSSTSSVSDAVQPDIASTDFVNERYDAIRQDAAAGGGENIDALASLMGMHNSHALALWMQAHYSKLFSKQSRPVDLITRIEKLSQQEKI